jgi:hypothetical protein
MKLCRTWLGRLGLAGACVLVTGCGSNVPDPSSDPEASSAPAPPGDGSAPIGPQAPADGGAAAKTEEAPAQAAAPAPPPANAQGGSTTAEMLAMAKGPGGSNPAPAPAGGAEPAPANPPAGGAGPGPGRPGMGGPAGAGGPGAMGMPMPGGGRMGRMGPDPAKMQEMMQANMGKMQDQMKSRQAGGMGMPGAAGAPGAPGGAAVDNQPADFHSPPGAVRAFLSALKAKDADRLNEATALRAQSESSKRNQPIFKKIFDLALSDSEFDDLSKKLDGYQIAGENPQESTGRVDVIIRKAGKNGGYFTRKVTVRHEKKGWGVFDVGPETEFKPMMRMPTRQGNRR